MRSSRSQRGRREHSIVLTHEEGTGHRYSGSEDGVTRRGGAVGGTGRWRHDTNARHRREQREHPVRSRASRLHRLVAETVVVAETCDETAVQSDVIEYDIPSKPSRLALPIVGSVRPRVHKVAPYASSAV